MTARKHKRMKQVEETRKTTRNIEFDFLTETQRVAYEAYCNNDVLFLVGPAGTGKTFLAIAFALRDVLARNRLKIILTRPIVEAGESLGYLPGSFDEKVHPFMIPLLDSYKQLLPGATLSNRIAEAAFEVAPLAYMRGRTFNDAVCIFDEAQNATVTQLKLFLTRFGQNSKIIVTGDPGQTDLKNRSGLNTVVSKLGGLEGVKIVEFTAADVVRHPLVAKILGRLNEDEA